MLTTVLLVSASTFAARPNQKQPLESNSRKFVLTVPIEVGNDPHGNKVWKITISDQQSKQLYKDNESTFVGHLNIYWIWDADDRVWVYNSDDGSVWFWELQNESWSKTNWGFKRNRRIDRDITPPPTLYPKYVD